MNRISVPRLAPWYEDRSRTKAQRQVGGTAGSSGRSARLKPVRSLDEGKAAPEPPAHEYMALSRRVRWNAANAGTMTPTATG